MILLCVLVLISAAWMVFSLVGRVSTDVAIPDSAVFRLSISNPVRLIDGILSHESLHEITGVPALAPALPFLNTLEDNPLMKNRLVRLAARGSIEFALLPSETLMAVWDMGFLSPLLRIFPMFSRFVNVPNLYYVQAGKNSRFEYRTQDMTLYIGPYRNLLFVTSSSAVFESRENAPRPQEGFSLVKPSAYNAVLRVSPAFFSSLLSEQDANIAAILNNIEFDAPVEVCFSIYPRKVELRLTAPLSSRQTVLSRLLEQRSQVPVMAERLPAASQYATILSAGTLEELFQAALVFSGPDFEDNIRRAESSSRAILGLTLDDLLFSWTGKEFAVFGMEGRPHPVYAIQIADERRRQEVFDRAFRSIALSENVRLNLDGVRIPQIEIPEFLQSLLRRWDIFLPSPYYIIHGDYLLASESAEALVSALRAMQRNDVLPRTAVWRDIAGGRNTTNSALACTIHLICPCLSFCEKTPLLAAFWVCTARGLSA